ncbi:motility associated factor glycosyltransferase family protein [Chitinivibrio alkaliphilus]|uniref:6-hydroxymethylpterin diphosphokinase MptE-like domain-containing protein n=1 Tax=Chitinivibrio alkaliphilus ACht1 TaxID=1313304 RepID=U7DBS8_9BACT|nr:6-hydroxymethylpterin diphosphokinase MptE-like protein [Chitinivibrio alkaliphilus]ERP31860.1 hypothetical protein CALK_1311 [Chitinivibrio alkaliphilus ACht1]
MQALGKTQRKIWERLDSFSDFSQSPLYSIDTVQEQPYLLRRRNNSEYIQFTSMMNPQGEAVLYADTIDFSKNRISVIQIGVGLGYKAREILNRLNSKSILFLCEEDPHLIVEFLRRHDVSQAIEKTQLLFISSGIESYPMEQQIKELACVYFPNMTAPKRAITFPVYDPAYIRFSRTVLQRLEEEKNYVKFGMGNSVDDTLVGLNNYLANHEYLLTHVGIREFMKTAQKRYRNKPAVIVASGPSLNKNISLLKEIDDRCLILSCDGSMNLLQKHGIRVDAVGSVERIMYTYDCFYRDATFPEETVVVAPTVVQPPLLEKFSRGITFPKAGIPTAEWVNQFSEDAKGSMICGPSVSHMLFSFAYQGGCDPIILIGQDLAYSEEGYSHNSEAEAVQKKVDTMDDLEHYVEDYAGNKLRSTDVWTKFLKAYENMIQLTRNTTVIDATEGGAYIRGTEILPLREVIDTYIAPSAPIDPLHRVYDEWEMDTDLYERSRIRAVQKTEEKIEEFLTFLTDVETLLDMLEEAREICDAGITTQKQLDFIYDTIDFGGKELLKTIRETPMYNILFRYYIQVAIYSLNTVDGEHFTEDNILKNIQILDGLYKKIELYAKKTVKVLLTHHRSFSISATEELKEAGITPRDYALRAEEFSDETYDLPFRVFYGNQGVKKP